MSVTFIEGIAAALMYLFGGALVLFIYEAYIKTRQKSLMYLAIGFFILIFGSNLGTLNAAASSMTAVPSVDESTARIISLFIQVIGIIVLLYSVLRPFEPRQPKE